MWHHNAESGCTALQAHGGGWLAKAAGWRRSWLASCVASASWRLLKWRTGWLAALLAQISAVFPLRLAAAKWLSIKPVLTYRRLCQSLLRRQSTGEASAGSAGRGCVSLCSTLA